LTRAAGAPAAHRPVLPGSGTAPDSRLRTLRLPRLPPQPAPGPRGCRGLPEARRCGRPLPEAHLDLPPGRPQRRDRRADGGPLLPGPCAMAEDPLRESGADLPLREVVLGRDGSLVEERPLPTAATASPGPNRRADPGERPMGPQDETNGEPSVAPRSYEGCRRAGHGSGVRALASSAPLFPRSTPRPRTFPILPRNGTSRCSASRT